MPSPASGRDQGGTDLLAQGAVDVRGDAPFPPRLIHPRVGSAAVRGYRAFREHPAWTRATSAAAERPPGLRPLALLSSLAPGREPPSAHLSGAGGRLPSPEGCGIPSPLFVGPGATWSCATTCRIFIFPFAKVAEKVADSAGSPGAGAPAGATGSLSPTPPPPPSLCPAPTSCPRAGAKLTHPSPGMGGCGHQALPEVEPAGPLVPARGSALARGAPRSRRPPPQPRSPPRRCAPACAQVPPRLAVSGPPGASLPR